MMQPADPVTALFRFGKGMEEFPFGTLFTLKYLIDEWQRESQQPECLMTRFADSVLEKIRSAPELSQPVEDGSIIERNDSVVDTLMSAVFPSASWEEDTGAIIKAYTRG